MNPRKITIVILATLSAASLALADDFKTINGKEYKNATVTRIEPDGIIGSLESLTYIICNSSGKVLQRKHGDPWTLDGHMAADYVELPAFDDSICVRFYHERLGNLGDYVIQRGGQVTARACQ